MPSVLESLNLSLHRAMQADPNVILLGEDLLDPYGGAFKVTKGLSTAFPERVWTSPISEAGLVGLASGMALRGLRPVVEIMFGDFITLAADQLINHAAKFRWMYNGQVRLPLLVRTPMGGRRGYGPTHSQTLEKLFLGIPGLRVLAPCAFSAGQADGPGLLLERLILESEDPTLFVENKLLYLLPVLDEDSLPEFRMAVVSSGPTPKMVLPDALSPFPCPTYTLSLRGAPAPVLTLAAYGYMAELARQAALRLAYELEIFVDLVAPAQLAPADAAPILASVERTGRLLVIEEGSMALGWGAEIVARAAESLGPRLKHARRLAALDLPIPASGPLEAAVLPGVAEIFETASGMLFPGEALPRSMV